MPSCSSSAPTPSPTNWFFRIFGFGVLATIAFARPAYPLVELDASWRMALGHFFLEGRQFGTEVIFTYGPLGFIMGNTYWGGQWASLIVSQVILAIIFTSIVFWQSRPLRGYSLLWYFLFFFIFGLGYQDGAHQIIIALVGLALIRRAGQGWHWSNLPLVTLLAALSLIKFTNIVLSVALLLLAAGLDYWTRRRPAAGLLPLLYALVFVLGWSACGQNPANLPAYFRSSWEISQGYQDTMGFDCPPAQAQRGLAVLLLIIAYVALVFFSATDRVRSGVLAVGTGAFIYLTWKHGFIRADGHQIGFYYAALTVVVTAPFLLEDNTRWRWPKHGARLAAALLSLYSLERVLPGLVTGALGGAQGEFHRNFSFLRGASETRELYDLRLAAERHGTDLRKTRSTVGEATLDVLGFEQAVALYHGFNYHARPVFQGYSAYTPYLTRLNHRHFAGDEAPEYVLFKLQTIDGRLPTMDDPHVLRILIQRYTYLFSEAGFTLWQRRDEPFDAAAYATQPLREMRLALGASHDVSDLADQLVWVEIDYRLNLLGKLRRFFYKPPLAQLQITYQDGETSLHRLPRPIGQAGFMLNPVVHDLMDFMRAAGGTPRRHAHAISLVPLPGEERYFRKSATARFARLPPSTAGVDFFKQADQALFHMFVDAPTSFTALNPPNEDRIDHRRVMILHAPSEMVFDVPAGATQLHGHYGFVPGAYTAGGNTNGAEFVIVWVGGDGEPVLLHERFLDPVRRLQDRGLHTFTVNLPRSSGQVFLRVLPGPFNEFAWDWTGWTGIEFK
jgi:hypothetical protein